MVIAFHTVSLPIKIITQIKKKKFNKIKKINIFFSNVAKPEPEPMGPKLFEILSRSRNYFLYKNIYYSTFTLEDARMKKN